MKKILTVFLFLTLQMVNAYGQGDCIGCPLPTDLSFTATDDNNYEYSFSSLFFCVQSLEVVATTTYCDGNVVQDSYSLSTSGFGMITGTLSLSDNGQPIEGVSFEYFTICRQGGFCANFCPQSNEQEITSEVGECACNDPLPQLVCVNGAICLFVRDVQLDDNPDYYLNGGQPSCIPGNWASPGDVLSYDIVCAEDPSQHWVVELPVPSVECTGPCSEPITSDCEGYCEEITPKVEFRCRSTTNFSFCVYVNNVQVSPTSDYQVEIYQTPTTANGCVVSDIAELFTIGNYWPVHITQASTGCEWVTAALIPDCTPIQRPTRSTEQGQAIISDLSMYPNPALDHVSIDLSEYAGETATINIYNNLGKVIVSQKIEEVSATPVYLPIADKNFGVHIVSIKIGNKKVISKKLMINIE